MATAIRPRGGCKRTSVQFLSLSCISKENQELRSDHALQRRTVMDDQYRSFQFRQLVASEFRQQTRDGFAAGANELRVGSEPMLAAAMLPILRLILAASNRLPRVGRVPSVTARAAPYPPSKSTERRRPFLLHRERKRQSVSRRRLRHRHGKVVLTGHSRRF